MEVLLTNMHKMFLLRNKKPSFSVSQTRHVSHFELSIEKLTVVAKFTHYTKHNTGKKYNIFCWNKLGCHSNSRSWKPLVPADLISGSSQMYSPVLCSLRPWRNWDVTVTSLTVLGRKSAPIRDINK